MSFSLALVSPQLGYCILVLATELQKNPDFFDVLHSIKSKERLRKLDMCILEKRTVWFERKQETNTVFSILQAVIM